VQDSTCEALSQAVTYPVQGVLETLIDISTIIVLLLKDTLESKISIS
jgi:hypothetical protein